MINQEPKLIIVDGSSYLFRAYYALPPLTNSKGKATGAILGVINMLKKLVVSYKPDWLVVVFDSKEPTFRHNLFPTYKANRSKMPDELAEQLIYLLKIIPALGFSILQVPGKEADDLIGSLVNIASKQGIFSIISTGDKDLAQLVNQNVILVNTMTDVVLDIKGVINKFKVAPELIVDYLVLIGDQVDNIPGVPNVGPKTAIKWLEKYKNLDGILEHSHEITGKVGDNLRLAITNFPLYKQLVTIDVNLDIDINIKNLTIKPQNTAQLTDIFTELEFKNWLKDVALEANTNTVPIIQQNIGDINIWLNNLEQASIFSLYLKTTDTNPMLAKIEGLYLATPEAYGYIPNIDIDSLYLLTKYLVDPNKIKVFYNLKYVIHVLANYNIDIKLPVVDISLESYVLNSLNKLELINNTDESAKNILNLHDNLWPQLCKEPSLHRVLEKIELPLLPVLQQMERQGVLIDVNKLKEQGVAIQEKIGILEDAAYDVAGQTFNLNSPKQLQEILYDKLSIPVLQKTPTGQPSTSEQVLQELALEFELPKIILEYRTLSKLQSTYIDKLPKTINAVTGRIHCCYHQTVTATGRLSSSDPNLQNIPIRTKEGRSIREAFIARSGYKILAADYSQIELRILAHLSQDPGLIRAFLSNIDIHTVTASEIFHVSISNITEELRRQAKAINFGLIYGMSDFGLARQLKISRKEANIYMNVYFSKFPKVLAFMEHTRKTAANMGYVETMFGRRLYLPDINSKNILHKKAAERAAINAPMQGAQADLIKMAMININNWLKQYHADVFMLMQVHDELVFEVPNNKIDVIKENVTKIMSSVAVLSVDLKVEIGVGNNWAEAH